MKPNDTRARIYAPHVKGKRYAISFITLGELRFWGYSRQWGKKRWDDLSARLRSVIVVPYDDAMCDVYAELKAEMSKSGVTVASNDLWIASCAVRHSITLITHNRSHFEKVPRLKMISECAVVQEIKSQDELPLEPQPDPSPSSAPVPLSSQSKTAGEEKVPQPAPRRP
jgi:predicted nucleic acid-binding protein